MKILITGTGRCGTTFLIKLFSLLNLDTGFNKLNYKDYIYNNCNSGMERKYDEPYTILKNPLFIEQIEEMINIGVKIKKVIIPIRNYDQSARSRLKYNKDNGGLWNATNYNTQILFYNKIISNYIYLMVKYNIDTIFIDFDKMITDKDYLYDKIKDILNEYNINYNDFSNIYTEILDESKS